MNPVIELFRGLAAWMVMTSHYYVLFFSKERCLANFFMTGYDLFFVISGFVFAKTIYGKDNPVILPYITRRFFRIYPLYFCSLIFYYIFTDPNPDKPLYFLKHLLFLHTTSSYEEASFFNAAYWTLPVEIEFYLLVPLLGILYNRHRGLIPFLLISSIVMRIVIVYHITPQSGFNAYTVLTFHLPGVFTEFIAGIMLFRINKNLKNRRIHAAYHMAAFAFGILLLSYLGYFFVKNGADGINAHLFTKAYFNTFCAAGYALILFSFLNLIKKERSRTTTSFLFMGKISYGVYLFHNVVPMIVHKFNYSASGLNGYLLCTAILIALSLVFHHGIEHPLRSFGRNLSRKPLDTKKTTERSEG
jgi:exopolysaccharide production protein ExoZ